VTKLIDCHSLNFLRLYAPSALPADDAEGDPAYQSAPGKQKPIHAQAISAKLEEGCKIKPA